MPEGIYDGGDNGQRVIARENGDIMEQAVVHTGHAVTYTNVQPTDRFGNGDIVGNLRNYAAVQETRPIYRGVERTAMPRHDGVIGRVYADEAVAIPTMPINDHENFTAVFPEPFTDPVTMGCTMVLGSLAYLLNKKGILSDGDYQYLSCSINAYDLHGLVAKIMEVADAKE